MTKAMHQFVAAFTAAACSAEVTHVKQTMDNQDWIWLITKASHMEPLGYGLAYFYLVLERDLTELTTLFNVSEYWLQQHIHTFFDVIEHLTEQEQQFAK